VTTCCEVLCFLSASHQSSETGHSTWNDPYSIVCLFKLWFKRKRGNVRLFFSVWEIRLNLTSPAGYTWTLAFPWIIPNTRTLS